MMLLHCCFYAAEIFPRSILAGPDLEAETHEFVSPSRIADIAVPVANTPCQKFSTRGWRTWTCFAMPAEIALPIDADRLFPMWPEIAGDPGRI